MDLRKLFASPYHDLDGRGLADEITFQSDLYKLSPGRPSDGSAFLVQLSKSVIATREDAIISMLLRLLVHSGILPPTPPYPQGKELYTMVLSQLPIAHPGGMPVSTETATDFYNWLDQACRETKEAVLTKNDLETDFPMLLAGGELLSAIAYTDQWNEKLYFIESVKDWWLLSWGTDV